MKTLSQGDQLKIRRPVTPPQSGPVEMIPAKGMVVSTEGPDPDKPIGIIVKDENGRDEFMWFSESEIGVDYYVATYYVPRLGLFTKVTDELDEFNPNYAPDRLIELRRFVFDGTAWTSEVIPVVIESTPEVTTEETTPPGDM